MEDQYGMLPDLRQYIDARPNFFPTPAPPTAADLLSGHCGLSQTHPYDMLVFPPEESAAAGTSSAVSNVPAGASSGGGGYGAFESGVGFGSGDGAAGRWPRQETLTLLEIRSRLDSKFKEANQKGPLWEEISRILSEEHGYQRSGKKCREKFENLYKYYKKTKEGKAGRQDGKHYRFFRQLEALYGDNNNNISSGSASEAQYQPHPIGGSTSFPYNFPKFSDNTSLSLSNYSEPDTTSSDDTDGNNNGAADPNGKGKMGWQAKIKDFIDLQMKNLMDRQEAWMEKMMTIIERKEQERLLREEEWRKQDAARIEQERRFWAGERAWIEARDAALMETLHKVTGMEFMAAADIRTENGNEAARCEMWMENEQRQKGLVTENAVWDDMGSKMGAGSCLIKGGKKRRENSKSCAFYGDEGVYCVNSNQQGIEPVMTLNDQSNASPNDNNGGNDSRNDTCNGVNAMSESCFRYFIGDGYGRIMD